MIFFLLVSLTDYKTSYYQRNVKVERDVKEIRDDIKEARNTVEDSGFKQDTDRTLTIAARSLNEITTKPYVVMVVGL